MTSTRDTFAAYLQAAMDAAGARAQDFPELTNGVVKTGTIYRWLRGEGDGELSVKILRAVAEVVNIPLLEMLAAAGVLTPIEAGLEDDPTPPPPGPTIEDEIRADKRLTPERRDVLISLLAELREEAAAKRTARGKTDE